MQTNLYRVENCSQIKTKQKFIVKIESNIKIKGNLKMLNYNNPDANIFRWRNRVRQMRWSEFGGADPDRFVQIKPWLHQLFCSAHQGFSQIFPWPIQACTPNLSLQL